MRAMTKTQPAATPAAAPELSERQRRHLRGPGARPQAGHPHRQPRSHRGGGAETVRALHDHELIKVKAPGGRPRGARRAARAARRAHRERPRAAHRQRRGALPAANEQLPRILIPDRLSRRYSKRTARRSRRSGCRPGRRRRPRRPRDLPTSARAIGEVTEMRPRADVGLVLADDLVGDRARRSSWSSSSTVAPKTTLPVLGSLPASMTSALASLRLDLVDAALDEALLLARGVVLGVLRQVAVAARLGDRLDDVRPVLGLQALQLRAQRSRRRAASSGMRFMPVPPPCAGPAGGSPRPRRGDRAPRRWRAPPASVV